jgi:hypothetical protein
MLLQAKSGYWLTESFAVAFSDRRFLQSVNLSTANEAKYWKEISNQEKESMIAQGQLFDVKDIDYEYLNKLDTLLSGLSEKMNEVELTDEQKIEKKKYFPMWSDLIGKDAKQFFNFQHGDDLFEVIMPHTFTAEWVPGEPGTESLYKKVSLHAGTKEDPIPWEKNMQLYEGKYYIDTEILYLCTRDSGIPLSYSLDELVGQYVTVVTEENPSKSDGSRDNPIVYEYAKTLLYEGKYYTQNGTLYLCKRNCELPMSYNLTDLISAGYVEVVNE